jgi:hypothetical protein
MKAFVRAAGVTVFVAALTTIMMTTTSSSLFAQWPLHPTPNAPRTAEGEPDLDAPTPRTADGRPVLAGLWRANGFVQPDADAPPDAVPVASFRDVGAGFKDGLPLTAWGAEVLTERIAGNGKDNPEAHCLPMGIMQYHTQGAPRKIVQAPDSIVILYEASMGLRQIFTDGRPLPDNDPQPWWYGYSVGHWDGDTLVVETTGLKEDGWLDIFGSPLTEQAKVTERFRRPTFGRMEIDITIDDPKAYTRPWTVRVNQRIMLDEELIEFICLENQRFTAR